MILSNEKRGFGSFTLIKDGRKQYAFCYAPKGQYQSQVHALDASGEAEEIAIDKVMRGDATEMTSWGNPLNKIYL